MQEQPPIGVSPLLHHIVNSNHPNLMHSILSFLSPQQISTIAQPALSQPHSSFFYQLALAHHFLNRFINRLDRTNYFLFYDQPEFKKIQSQNILHLVADNHHSLILHHRSFNCILTALKGQLAAMQHHEELASTFDSLFFETDLALPQMKRETIGMYCQSSLQDFLSLLSFPSEEMEQPWIEQCIIQLKSQTENDLQQLINHFPYYQSQQPASTAHEKVRVLRFTAYKITHENWREYLIPDFRMHNLIVIIFALCSQLVASYHFLMQHLEDPFLRFTQFSLRANVYRNMILNVEEKFSFLFDSYSRFYQNVYSPPSDRPAFRFWLPALSIWIQTMKVHHPSNERVYNYVSSKMRQASLLTFLQARTEKLPSYFSALRDQVEMHLFSESRKTEAYQENDSRVELQCFFENNQELYEIVVKDYLEYMVDISINQFNVHRCGHSKHAIAQHPLFLPFQNSIVAETTIFHSFIKDLLFASSPPELRLGFFKEVVKEDLSFCEQKLAKPVIIRQIVDRINDMTSLQIQKMTQYAIFQQQGIAKYKIHWDFQQKDTLLDYFCTKYQIVECEERLRFYYNCQVNDCNEVEDSDCDDSFEYCEEYISDEEGGND